MKQYILVRTDKEFPIGKIIAHCSHNAVRNLRDNMYYEDMTMRHTIWYYENDTTTIVLDGRSLDNIERIINKAKKIGPFCLNENIPTSFVEDITLKEKICAVIGPVNDEEAKELGLKKLRLYKYDK